jgi:hypothetical protein
VNGCFPQLFARKMPVRLRPNPAASVIPMALLRRILAVQKGIELAGLVDGVEIIRTTDMGLPDEDLWDGASAAAASQH